MNGIPAAAPNGPLLPPNKVKPPPRLSVQPLNSFKLNNAVDLDENEENAMFNDLRQDLLVPKPIGPENRNSISEVIVSIPKLHSVPQRGAQGDNMKTKK